MKISIKTVTGGAPMAKPIKEAKQLLEDMALNNYRWVSEQANPKEVESMRLMPLLCWQAWLMHSSKRRMDFNLLLMMEPLVDHLGK